MSSTHPRVLARGTKGPEAITQVIPRTVIHVIVYAPERMGWIEQELGGTAIQVARDVEELVAVLVEDSRTRPQMLVVDLDALSAGELLHLHQIRERGWCGEIIALGQVPPSLRASLKIACTIRSFVKRALSDALIRYRCATEGRTMPLPVFADEAPAVQHKTYG